MKNILFSALITGLIALPVSQAKTLGSQSPPACAQGKLIATFDKVGQPAASGIQYYRCLLKQDQSGYQVQDFYWPSAKRQTDPFVLTDKKDLEDKWRYRKAIAAGSIIVWNENGQKASESQYANGKETGQWTVWYENGQKKQQGNYELGKKKGLWTLWYENGQKDIEGQYVDGKASGPYTFWYKNGQKVKEGRYTDGKQTGPWTVWFENGQKQQQGAYVDGKETGLWTRWYENGQKQVEAQLKDGEPISTKMWDKDGKSIAAPK